MSLIRIPGTTKDTNEKKRRLLSSTQSRTRARSNVRPRLANVGRNRFATARKRIVATRPVASRQGMMRYFNVPQRSAPSRAHRVTKANHSVNQYRYVQKGIPSPCHTEFPRTFPVRGLSENQVAIDQNRPRVAMLIPTTSRGMPTIQNVSTLEFFRVLLPSFLNSLKEDACMFDYNFYIGCDQGDLFFDKEATKQAYRQKFYEICRAFPRVKLVEFMSCVGTQSAPCYVWNQLFLKAYQDNNDYFYQTGDDVEFTTAGWTKAFVSALRASPNEFGAAGPFDVNNSTLMTQSFVSRTHMHIFDTYYPRFFKNWHSDGWMADIYKKHNAQFWMKNYKVTNKKQKERYTIQKISSQERDVQQAKSTQLISQWRSRPLKFSIMICSLDRRWYFLSRLRHLLNAQLASSATGTDTPNYNSVQNQLEILIDYTPEITIGEKRNRMVRASKGEYICFVDDDDLVSANYVMNIMNILMGQPQSQNKLDCIGFNGLMYSDGTPLKPFFHSVANKKWAEDTTRFYRSPNHWNPIRRDLVVKFPYLHVNWAEDKDFSDRIQSSLRTEVMVQDNMYNYFFVSKKKA